MGDKITSEKYRADSAAVAGAVVGARSAALRGRFVLREIWSNLLPLFIGQLPPCHAFKESQLVPSGKEVLK
jgi:hypothetical protein